MREHLLLFYSQQFWYLGDGICMTGRPTGLLGRRSFLVRCEHFWPYKAGPAPSGLLVTSLSVGGGADSMDLLLLMVPHAHVQTVTVHNKTPWILSLAGLGDTSFSITMCSHLPFSTYMVTERLAGTMGCQRQQHTWPRISSFSTKALLLCLQPSFKEAPSSSS